MTIISSKKISYGIIFFLNFLTGVEYAVILPTALQYLERFGGSKDNQVELGLCLSAYSFSSLFSSPIMGRLSDLYDNTKMIMIVANLFQIFGSLMYFIGINSLFIVSSRLVAGIGLGVLSCTFSDVVKNTTLEERSSILSLIMVGRQIGMIIGPAFNFILLNLNYKVKILNYDIILDKLSAPGVLMAIFWVILQILTIFFYKNLNKFDNNIQNRVLNVNNEIEQHDNERTSLISNNTHNEGYNSINYDEITRINENNHQDDNNQQLSVNQSQSNRMVNSNSVRIVDNSETGPFFVKIYKEYVREEVIATYFAAFAVFFMQTTLETLLTPFTRDYFDWHDIENSIMYGIAGVEIMIVFLSLSFLSKKISDRVLLLTGLFGNLASLIFLIFYLPRAIPNQKRLQDYLLFTVPVFFNVFSLPFIVLSSISLLSKLTSSHMQGLTQGLRRTTVGVACILGPIWAGALYKTWYILVGTLIGLIALCLLMTLISFKYLKIEKSPNQQESKNDIS